MKRLTILLACCLVAGLVWAEGEKGFIMLLYHCHTNGYTVTPETPQLWRMQTHLDANGHRVTTITEWDDSLPAQPADVNALTQKWDEAHLWYTNSFLPEAEADITQVDKLTKALAITLAGWHGTNNANLKAAVKATYKALP